MEKLKKLFSKTWILVILLSLFAGWGLLPSGFYGASDDMHIAWLYEMDRTLKLGQFPPRYVPDLSFGFGYPLFNFVFPLPFYLAEIFHILNLSLVDSVKTVFFLSIPLSAFFMYLFLREFGSKWLSFIGAIIYVYTPYRAVDLYIRGAIGEIVVFVLLPILALSIVKLTTVSKNTKGLNLRWIGIGGVVLASLALSHNITVYMFLPFILFLGLIKFFLSPQKLKLGLQFSLAIFSGLLASIYFWLPAVVESNLMKYDTVFNFADHFPTIKQLLTPYWGYGASVPGPGDGMPFFLGTVNLLVVFLGIIFFILYFSKYSLSQKIVLSWVTVSFLLAFFMMNYRSIYLWQHLPLLSYFQFPWRFLMMTTFLTPLFLISFEKFKFKYPFIFLLVGLAIVLNVGNFRPEHFLGRQDDYYLNRYIPVPKASREYYHLKEEYLRLPKISQKRPDKNYPLVESETGGILKITQINDLNIAVETFSQKPVILNYSRYLFPGWEVKIDGQKTQSLPGIPFGQIKVFVPSGQHKININFHETTFKKILDIISFFSFLILVFFTLNLKKEAKIGKV